MDAIAALEAVRMVTLTMGSNVDRANAYASVFALMQRSDLERLCAVLIEGQAFGPDAARQMAGQTKG